MASSRIMFLLFCTFLCFVQSMNHNPLHTSTTEEDIIVIPTAQLVAPSSTDVAVVATAQVIEQPPAKSKTKVEQPPKGPRYYIYRADSDCFLGFHVEGSNPDADLRISKYFAYSPPMKNTFQKSYTWCRTDELQEWTMEPNGKNFDLVARKTTFTYEQVSTNSPRKYLKFLKPKVKTIQVKHVQTFRIEDMWKLKMTNWKTEGNYNNRRYLIKSPDLYMLGKGERWYGKGENYLWDNNKFVHLNNNEYHSRFTQGYIIQEVQPGLKEKLLEKIDKKAEAADQARKYTNDLNRAMGRGNGFSW